MIILSYPHYLSPECTWTCSIVWIPLFWLSNPILSRATYVNLNLVNSSCLNTPSLIFPLSVSRAYVNSINCLNIVHLITLLSHWHPHLSPVCTWTCSTVWVPLIWLSHPILSSTPWLYVNLVDSSCFFDHPILPFLSVCRAYVNLLNCLNTPHLNITFYPLQDAGNVRELGQFKLFEYFFSDFPILPSLSVSRAYVNFINCV